MTKTIFEEMGGTYRQVGDYLLPNITVPAEEEIEPMVILSGKMINKESLIYIVLNLQMTELFMREIYFHQKLFPVLEKLEI